jgi:hypothetical protein
VMTQTMMSGASRSNNYLSTNHREVLCTGNYFSSPSHCRSSRP